jgi:primase-polymerase (primpol)-like protein
VAPRHSDDAILARARAARNADKFIRLFDQGETAAFDHDESRADLALIALLAFWTQDPEQLDRLFRRSGLYRDKWERRDYRERTIATALKDRDFHHVFVRTDSRQRAGLGRARVGSMRLG